MEEFKDVKGEEVLNEEGVEKYSRYYDAESFLDKVKVLAMKAGSTVIYAALLLYEMLRDDSISLKTKGIIVAALGYLILPLDIIPDVAPILGFTDDLAVLIYVVAQIRDQITPIIRERAIEKVSNLFPTLSAEELEQIQKKVM